MEIALPRVRLTQLPTPIEPMERLSGALEGPRIFIKRDDLTGLAGGGNKTRKLEFLAAEALSENCDSLVTVGAAQSNHCRQTAAAAARCGLRSILVLRGAPPVEPEGNILLDLLLGAELRFAFDRPREQVMAEVVEAERAAGRRPYAIPLGGSTGLGALGYVAAMQELAAQGGKGFDRVVFASSSGGTHAGMALGARLAGFPGEVLGISIDEELEPLREMVARIANDAAVLLAEPVRLSPEEIVATADYLGAGYGVMGAPEREAIALFARLEGILVDPVYTGRAAAGMIDLIRRGRIGKGERILFWHTGGVPALWAYREDLRGLMDADRR